jgi:hypothetical protein
VSIIVIVRIDSVYQTQWSREPWFVRIERSSSLNEKKMKRHDFEVNTSDKVFDDFHFAMGLDPTLLAFGLSHREKLMLEPMFA